ncbi:MAG: hypothetical protein RXR74_00480 [Nitrososphaeria archaeon]
MPPCPPDPAHLLPISEYTSMTISANSLASPPMRSGYILLDM